MPTALPVESFLAFASIVYADGETRRGELEGFRRAAKTYSVSEKDLESIESRAKDGLALGDIDFPGVSDWQGALTYAFAVWIAKVDGIINKEENQLLAELGDKLGLDKMRRDAARSATYDIAALPGGHKPEKFDFAALEAQLEMKLPGSFKRHQGQSQADEMEVVEEVE